MSLNKFLFLFKNNFNFNNFNIVDRLKGAPSRERLVRSHSLHMSSYDCGFK